MALSNSQYDEIMREYDRRQLNNRHLLNDLCHSMDPTRPTTLACYAV